MKNSNATKTQTVNVKNETPVKTPKVVETPVKTPKVVETPVIAPVKAEKPAKAEKVARIPIVVTLEQALKTKEEAQVMVGKICEFVMMGEAIWRTGEVTTITHDKRNNRVFYRIFDADGKMYHKTVGSLGFKVDEEASEKLAKQRAEAQKKADEAKSQIAKMISDAKETARIAKEKLAEARKATLVTK